MPGPLIALAKAAGSGKAAVTTAKSATASPPSVMDVMQKGTGIDVNSIPQEIRDQIDDSDNSHTPYNSYVQTQDPIDTRRGQDYYDSIEAGVEDGNDLDFSDDWGMFSGINYGHDSKQETQDQTLDKGARKFPQPRSHGPTPKKRAEQFIQNDKDRSAAESDAPKPEERAEADEPQQQPKAINEDSNKANNSAGTEPEPIDPEVHDPIEKGFQDVEKYISDKFEPGETGAESLKKDLEDYVTDGGSPLLGWYLATQLDLLKLSMGVAKSIPLGYLDLRNIGEGVEQGDWEGYKRDINRVLTLANANKVTKAVDMALAVDDARVAFTDGGLVDGAQAATLGVVSSAGGRRKPRVAGAGRGSSAWKKTQRGGAYGKVQYAKGKRNKEAKKPMEETEIDHMPPMNAYKMLGVKIKESKASAVEVLKKWHRDSSTTGSSGLAKGRAETAAAQMQMGKYSEAFDTLAKEYTFKHSNDPDLKRALAEAKRAFMKDVVPELNAQLSN